MSQTEKYQVGDLIIHEADLEFNREAKTIDVANNAEIKVGDLLEAGAGPPEVKALATDANCAYVCLENYKNTTGATVRKTIPVIWRGGSLILSYNRLGDGATSKATAVAALLTALGGGNLAITRTDIGG